jgi:C_GCAxxG_C_C family probable redox protein
LAKNLSKTEILDQIESEAKNREKELRGCGRCCLSTLLEYLELVDKRTVGLFQKALLPMSGGIAQEHQTCGALLGGLMAIGIACLPSSLEEVGQDERKALANLSRQYYRRFEKEIGHTRCFDIREVGLGRCFDTVDPDEKDRFEAAGGRELCSKVVGKAARLAAEFILDNKKDREYEKK